MSDDEPSMEWWVALGRLQRAAAAGDGTDLVPLIIDALVENARVVKMVTTESEGGYANVRDLANRALSHAQSLSTKMQDCERRLADLAKGYRDIAGNEESSDPVEKGGALGMLSGLFDSIEKLANETNIRTYDNRKAIEEMSRRVETQAGILERFVSVGEIVDRAALDKAIATLGAAVHDRVRKLELRVQSEVLDALPGLITESVGTRINEALGELDEAFDWALRYRDEVIRRARRSSLVGALVERLRGG